MAENKLQCEIVQDLLPSYVDGLTSDVTNEAVKEHLEGCEKCTRTIERMKEKDEVEMDASQEKEIDFLKKTRRKTWCAVFVSALLVIGLVAGGLFIRFYCIGTTIYPETVVCRAKVSDKTVTVSGTLTDSAMGISETNFEEKDGVVTISFKGTLASSFHTGDFQSEYTAKEPITQVRLGERIIWDNGMSISANVSAAYNARHPYIGNASANGESLWALAMYNVFGDFDSELQTEKEPYGWTLHLYDEILTDEESRMQKYMDSYAYVLLATIDNLGYVTYDYVVRGEHAAYTVTVEDANTFAGMNIKTCGETPAKLQRLMEKTGLNQYGYSMEKRYENYLYINVINNTEGIEIKEMQMKCYVEGEETTTTGCAYADGHSIKKNDVITFDYYLQDFGRRYNPTSEIKFELELTDMEGEVYKVNTPIQLVVEEGDSYNYILTGDVRGGFELYQ